MAISHFLIMSRMQPPRCGKAPARQVNPSERWFPGDTTKSPSGGFRWLFFMEFVGLILFLFAGCASKPLYDPYELVLGTWKTEKGIFMTVEMTPEGAARAAVKLSPGYGGEDVSIGKVIISRIKPERSGGYSGMFAMPGDLKPVKVEISVLHRDTMLLLSGDRRVKGYRMVWRRVREAPGDKAK